MNPERGSLPVPAPFLFLFMLQATGLRLEQKDKLILDGIDLAIGRGEIVCLTGPNGSGKTSLLKSLLGLYPRQPGSVTFNGIDLKGTGRHEALREIGTFLPPPALYPFLSGVDHLRIVQHYFGRTRLSVDKVLRLFRLEDVQHDKVKTYSLGMQQRLSLAMAFLNQPALLLLDEPFNAIDRNNTALILDLIRFLNETYDTSFLLTSHSLEDVEKIHTRFLVLHQGQLLLDQPASPGTSVSDLYARLVR